MPVEPQPIQFSLQPFETTARSAGFSVSGTVTRAGNVLSLTYLLAGDLTKVSLPSASAAPARKDRLWEQTCFEFFLAQGASHSRTRPYWEFNLSPTGDWNVFSLQGYRQGLQEESAFSELPFTVWPSAEGLRLEISVDVGSMMRQSAEPVRLGVSMVMITEKGEESFWAIAHPTPAADFHHPDSFTLLL